MSKVIPVPERERRKQRYWAEEVASIINSARALTKYRGQDADKLFTLKMDLANAVAEYDSKPNSV